MAPFRYPLNVGSASGEKWIRFDVMSGRHLLRGMVPEAALPDNSIQTIVLYLNESVLKSTLSVDWAQNDLGALAGTTQAAMVQTGREAQSILSGPWSNLMKPEMMASAFISGAVDSYLHKLPVRIVDAVNSKFGDKIVEQGTGTKTNPRTEIFFNSQQYRTNEMSFTLIPRNIDEAIMIDGIVQAFQYYMLPSYTGGGGAASAIVPSEGGLMGFPFEFNINIFASQPENPTLASLIHMRHVAKIGRSVLKNVTVDHAGGEKVSFIQSSGNSKTGPDYWPAVTRLNLSWQECRLLARGDPEINRELTMTEN